MAFLSYGASFFAADRFSFWSVMCCRRRCPKVAFVFVVDSWCFIFSPLWRINCGFGVVCVCTAEGEEKELESPT